MKRLGRWIDPSGAAMGPSLRELLDRARAGRRPGSLTLSQAAQLFEWNRSRGAAATLEAAWNAIAAGRGRVVVTGQQPALAGGPLYSLYKLLTAEALAREIARETGEPCLAVFWIVGDDSDFGEVSQAWLPSEGRGLVRIRDDAPPEAGWMIGRLPPSRHDAALAKEPALSGDGPIASRSRAWIAEAASRDDSWSGMLARLVYARIPDLDALFIDGAHPAVIEAQSPWLAAMGERPLARWLAEGTDEARAAGYEPSLAPELGERALFRLDGARREPAGPPWRPEAALAPNVALRPLVQDLLLPNAATVGGAAEIRYRAQLGPLYRGAGIPAPLTVPRLSAVLLPPLRSRPVIEALDGDAWLALRDPDAWIDRLALGTLPEVRAGVERLRGVWEEALAGWRETLRQTEPALMPLADSAQGKVDFQLKRLEEGIVARERQRLFRSEPSLARWREFVRPREREQERALSLLTPFLYSPRAAASLLRAAAREHLEQLGNAPSGRAVFLLEPPSGGAAEREGEERR